MPLRIPGLNLNGWWERITRQTLGEPPPLRADGIVPVVTVGDHSHLVPRPPLAYGICGFATVGVAGQFTSMVLTGYSPGGNRILAWQVGSGQGVPTNVNDTRIRWGIGNPQNGPATGGISYPNIVPGRPCTSKASSTNAAATNLPTLSGDIPTMFGGIGLSAPQVVSPHFNWTAMAGGGIWIPQGLSLVFEGQLVQQGLLGWILFEELDAIGDE